MKRFFSLFLTAALTGAGFVSCSDDPEDQPVVPTDVEKVSGIETNYVLGLHEYLEITPDIELSNENESISYEWSIEMCIRDRIVPATCVPCSTGVMRFDPIG